MAEFRLGRLKFNWRGDWTGSTAYVIDDLVRFGANSYVCVGNHTSQALAANFTSDAANWELHTGGFDSKGDWTTTTAYVEDDIVKEGGNMYICTNQHTSSGLSSSFEGVDLPANWKLFQEGLNLGVHLLLILIMVLTMLLPLVQGNIVVQHHSRLLPI